MNRNASPPPLDFHRRESVRNGVIRLLQTLAETAAAQAARTASERDASVHVTRLVLKRARAMVRLLEPTLGTAPARTLNLRLRLAARRLAPARDASVGISTLDLLARDADSRRRKHLAALRESFARVTGCTRTEPAAVARALAGAATAVRGVARSLPRLAWRKRGWAALEAGLHASYRRARRRFKTAYTGSSESAFHEWRSAVKVLQYHVAALRPASPKRLGALTRSLDELGSRLGREHDFAVLAATLAERPDDFGGAATVDAVRTLAASRQQSLRKDALKLGRRLFTDRPACFVETVHRAWKSWRRT